LKELFTAPGFIVESYQQTMRRPDAAPSPGSQRRRLVQRRAEAVACAQNGFVGDAALPGAHSELADPPNEPRTALLRRRLGVRRAYLRDKDEQRIRRGNKRVQLACVVRRHVRISCQARIAQNSSCKPGNSPARCSARPPELS